LVREWERAPLGARDLDAGIQTLGFRIAT